MQKKYFPIYIDDLLDHKMMCNSTQQVGDNENTGVMGTVITDQRYDYVAEEKYIKGVRFKLFGSQARYDNFISNGQTIHLPKDNQYKKLAIIGFNEFYSYKHVIQVMNKNQTQDRSVMFYHMNENVSALFENEVTKGSFKILTNQSNTWQKVNYFCDVVDIKPNSDRLICPISVETHIVAMTAIQ